MKKRGFWGIIAFLSSNVGVKDWCTRFHMRVMLKKVPFWNSSQQQPYLFGKTFFRVADKIVEVQ